MNWILFQADNVRIGKLGVMIHYKKIYTSYENQGTFKMLAQNWA